MIISTHASWPTRSAPTVAGYGTCRLGRESSTRTAFRRDLGGEVEAYQEVARRLGLLPEGADSAVLDLEKHRLSKGK